MPRIKKAAGDTWNWQQADWPNFQYDSLALQQLENDFLRRSGVFLGAFLHVSEEEKLCLSIDLMITEALKTSEIEGEILNRESVQSSIRRHLGLTTDRRSVNPAEAGVAEMMVDLYHSFRKPLSHKMLLAWQAMILNGRRDVEQIGAYRKHDDPMQVVSGRLDNPKVHFEAPPSKCIPKEMDRFIDWFNSSASGGKNAVPAVTRAAIAHLYFESIHPFEDGNGRIGRAISEKALAQGSGKPAMVALSQTIFLRRKTYYEMLEKSNKSNIIDGWLAYFGKTILEGQDKGMKLVEFIIQKAKYYERFREKLNLRQLKVMERIFREGIGGFIGGLSAENYLAITGTSRATATRDLVDLVKKGALIRTGMGKGTRYKLPLQKEKELYSEHLKTKT